MIRFLETFSRTLFFVYIVCTALGCDAQESKKPAGKKDTRAALKPASDTALTSFKLMEVVRKTRLWDCNIITSRAIADVDSFLQTHIRYFSIDPLPPFDSTRSELLFRKILTDSKSIQTEPAPGTYTFTQRSESVYDYGDCILGEFVFPQSSNTTGHKLYVILNLKAKDVSVWNFENLRVTEKYIDGKINVKGKIVDYRMRYSITCNRFVLN